MIDEKLLIAVRQELRFLSRRGFPTFAQNVEELAKRFERLSEIHKLLAEREERLTQELIRLKS